MPKIKHARFLRAIETEDSLTAEVEFALDGDAGGAIRETPAESRTEFAGDLSHPSVETGRLTAVLKKEGDAGYRLERICRDLVAGGRDGEDVADQIFSGPSPDGERAQFVQDVLAFEGVREDLEGRRES